MFQVVSLSCLGNPKQRIFFVVGVFRLDQPFAAHQDLDLCAEICLGLSRWEEWKFPEI